MVDNRFKLVSKLLWSLLASMVLIISSIPPSAFALDGKFDQAFYSQNDILFYNPLANCATNTGALGAGVVPSYKNPIINKNAPDPAVIQGSDGTYYMYVSGLHLYTSKDAVNWTSKGNISVSGRSLPRQLWAPDIAKVNNIYVLSWAEVGSGKIAYATSDSPGGSFTYRGTFSLGGGIGIDPQIFNDNGHYYLYYASSNNIYVSSLGVNGTSIKDGTSHSVLNRLDVSNEDWTVEAPWVIYRNGYFYLFYSTGKWDGGAGFSKDNYDLRVAKSKSPTGQFERKGQPILTKSSHFTGPGTATVFSDSTSQDWLIYHARPNGGADRTPMLDPITYVNGWPEINGGNGPSYTTQPGSTVTATTSGSGIYSVDNKIPSGKQFHPGDKGGLGHENAADPYTYPGGDSINGIKEAIGKGGYGQIDQDTRMTKDGVPILNHNSTAGSHGYTGPGANTNVADLTLAQLKGLTNHGVNIASLEDVLSYVKSKHSNIVVQVEWKINRVITEQEISTIANLYNKYGVRGAFKGGAKLKGIADSLYVAQKHGFWVRSTKYDGNGWVGEVWHAPTVSSATSSPTSTSANGCACPTSSTSSASLSGRVNLEKIYNYFIGNGLSDVQAAGIVGNISQESGGFPMRKQGRPPSETYPDPSSITSGWGIIQWTPGSKISSIAKQAGVTGPINELGTQLDILWAHMHNKPGITTGKFNVSDYGNISDLNAAVDYFEKNIEGAGKPAMVNRYAAAKLALDQFGGKSSTSQASTSTQPTDGCGGSSSGAVSGNIVETAMNYAWPTYHAPNYTKLEPAYAAAITKAQAAGKYVGGGPNPGVDCGGFVTRVMQDSGVDPKYGGGGATDAQLAYLIGNPKYKELKNPTSSDLTPGAIAIKTSGGGHTYLYVGKQQGFQTQVASSSYSPSNTAWRAPMAGQETPADPAYRWFVLQ